LKQPLLRTSGGGQLKLDGHSCKSAPKRDPARICNKPLIYQRCFLETGVPIGADLDPTKLSFYGLISSPLEAQVEVTRYQQTISTSQEFGV
jgi:hypothetical protein